MGPRWMRSAVFGLATLILVIAFLWRSGIYEPLAQVSRAESVSMPHLAASQPSASGAGTPDGSRSSESTDAKPTASIPQLIALIASDATRISELAVDAAVLAANSPISMQSLPGSVRDTDVRFEDLYQQGALLLRHMRDTTRQLTAARLAQSSGEHDSTPSTESAAAVAGAVPSTCAVTPWSDWTVCTARCGGGTQHQHRMVIVADTALRAPSCQTPPLVRRQSCHTHACPRASPASASTRPSPPPVLPACKVGPWSEFSACDRGSGPERGGACVRSRRRIAIETPSAHCQSTRALEETVECPAFECHGTALMRICV
jgi:hypothetical protein